MASSSIYTPMAATSRTAILGPSGRHGAALQGSLTALPSRSGLKDAGRMLCAVAFTSLSLPPPSLRGTPLCSGSEHIKKAGSSCTDAYRRSAVGVVRASSIGVVKEVTQESKEPLYYSVTLEVSPASEVATWYTTPGQYANLIPVKSQHASSRSFFLASPLRKRPTELEFLIQDVPNTVANEIINSKPGDHVAITTNAVSTGFDLSKLCPPSDESESVLMFASGYGLSPFRALIETGFQADKRKDAILYAMYTEQQMPYEDRFASWTKIGVKIVRGEVVLAASFEKRGVPADKILSLFGGIPTSGQSYYNKVLHQLNYYPKFPHHAEKHIPVELKI